VTTPASILVGTFDGFTWVRCEGKGTFVASPRMKQYCETRIADGETLLVIDLAACSGMDSTFMGTLAGLAVRLAKGRAGAIHVAEPGERNRASLEDLGLGALLQIDPAAAPWRDRLEEARGGLHPVGDAAALSDRQRAEQVLEAHRVLSATHEPNARKFAGVVQVLEAELAPKPGNA
jgi:anti-anti-sigma regulatory factor